MVNTVINLGIFIAILAVASGTAVATTGACPAEPGAAVKSSSPCGPCADPFGGHNATLVVVITLADGGYVAVWQDTSDSRVYGQCYTRAGLPCGAQFRINADMKEGILPVVFPQEDGGFVVRWKQYGHSFEQHFSAHGVPLEDATLRK